MCDLVISWFSNFALSHHSVLCRYMEASLVSLVVTGVPELELTGAKGLTRRTHATNGGPAGRGCVQL